MAFKKNLLKGKKSNYLIYQVVKVLLLENKNVMDRGYGKNLGIWRQEKWK